ncbi:HNH endonuclease signature motif containing protein [Paenibacillus sp. sgz5001063]|uniref:HNH endonuclease signature motif containing protein n=1 Tax=Paenibacillus sp. sgz5001063 TaxID=3242474 RepID=UPI0036D31057
MESRIPPTEIRRELRKEIDFGCPIQGCGSPFLEYHHFNPPWHEGHTHNLEGMIALCPSHHIMADRGTWTIKELELLKKQKANNKVNPVRGKLYWNLINSVVMAGSNFLIVQDRLSLRVLENEIFGLSENENGQMTLNALLRDQSGEIIIHIIDNDIIVAPDKINDFVCNASGNKIRIESRKSQIYLEFSIKREKINKMPQDLVNLISSAQVEIPLISLKAKVISNLFDISIQNNQIVLDFRKLGYDKTSLSNRIIGPSGSINITVNNHEFVHLG